MTTFKDTIQHGAQIMGIDITDAMLEQFAWYSTFLIEENNKFNLTTIIDPMEVAEKHFLDSLLIAENIKELSGFKMIDIGSGAGFPGLPIKIYRPDIKMVLLETVGKKANFINQVVANLHLPEAQAVHARAEDLARKQREQYDVAISRAVAEMRVLVEYALPFVKIGGFFIAYKGSVIDEELKQAQKAIQLLGGAVAEIKKIKLPISNDPRTLISIRKIKATPDKYPRRAGLPKKKPL